MQSLNCNSLCFLLSLHTCWAVVFFLSFRRALSSVIKEAATTTASFMMMIRAAVREALLHAFIYSPLLISHIYIRSISTVCTKAQCKQRDEVNWRAHFCFAALFLLSLLSLSLAQYGYIHVARLRLCITKVDEVRSGSLNCKDDDASWEWKLKPFLWMFSLLFIVACERAREQIEKFPEKRQLQAECQNTQTLCFDRSRNLRTHRKAAQISSSE